MKKTPERVEILAAEYVLGSLEGPARRRFECWMMESHRVRQEVWYWEQTLGALANSAEPEQPPGKVWAAIGRRLWPEAANESPKRSSSMSWLWPSWGAIATAAALVLAVFLLQQPAIDPVDRSQLSGAIVQANSEAPLWLINESVTGRGLKLRSVAASAAETGKDYELWVVPEAGQPLSLGVVPIGSTHQIALSDEAMAQLAESRTLAISLEPAGGSPTGSPTGPILHVTELYSM